MTTTMTKEKKEKDFWKNKVERLPLLIKLLAITILMPALIIVIIALLYINTTQYHFICKKRRLQEKK